MMKQLQTQIAAISQFSSDPGAGNTSLSSTATTNTNVNQQRDSLMMQAIKRPATYLKKTVASDAVQDWGATMVRMANVGNGEITAESLVNWVKTGLYHSMSMPVFKCL